MNIRIEDGKTIITTDRKSGETINKTKVKGLTYREESNKYTLAIVHNGKKYHIGNYKTLEEAKAIRKKADSHLEDGTFIQWVNDFCNKRVLNSLGVKGLYKKPNSSVYQMNISYKGKKYYLGSFKSVEDARIVREEADERVADGTFELWIKNKKNGDE